MSNKFFYRFGSRVSLSVFGSSDQEIVTLRIQNVGNNDYYLLVRVQCLAKLGTKFVATMPIKLHCSVLVNICSSNLSFNLVIIVTPGLTDYWIKVSTDG